MDIEKFYAGKNVFLTGSTGFLGKVVLEKLLRSCSRVNKVYLLVRAKKDMTPQQRVDGMLSSKMFASISQEGVDVHSKVIAVAGDISEMGLGLSTDDREMLQEVVDIVIHSAATVRFDEDLRVALKMNVVGVKEMISLCKGIKNLKALVHVSTAYANCGKETVHEKVYPPVVESDKLIPSVEWMDDAMIEALTPVVIGTNPNTYTFTKSLAEYIITRDAKELPVAIFRPSIIGAALREPHPGWVDNYNGPSGLIIAAGKGMMRTMIGCPEAVSDIIPVDTAANMLISVAWHVGCKRDDDIPVYHCTTGSLNPCTWGLMVEACRGHFFTYPMEKVFRRPNFNFESRKLMYYYWTYISHKIPACIADILALFVGQKPKVFRLYKKIEKNTKTFHFFTTGQWEFTTDNYLALIDEMSEHDKKVFSFDVRDIDWNRYFESYVLGLKQFVLKEDLANLPVARGRIRKLRNIRWTMYAVLVALFSWLMISKVRAARQLWFRCLRQVQYVMRILNWVHLAN